MFNIIARRTLNEYAVSYPEAKVALQRWYYEMAESTFQNFNEVKEVYVNASLVADGRVIFNICGNKYRLVVRINFKFKAVQVKWFGTHVEYDKINVETVTFKKKRS